MAYKELVKDLSRTRDYLRQFYVYGFKTRSEYSAENNQSPRTYDNERRRLESWLEEYMQSRKKADGKYYFLQMDSRAVTKNPLYVAFKAKSFTDNDIMLHFFLLDMLADGSEKSVSEITNCLYERYFSKVTEDVSVDDTTIRSKLKEYAELGLLLERKAGRELYYKRNDDSIELTKWQEAIAYFSENMPVGVLGSTLLDKLPADEPYFYHKHHYILQALDSEYLLSLLSAIEEHRKVTLVNDSQRTHKQTVHVVLPLRIFHSTQMGKDYVFCYHYHFERITSFRLDNVTQVDVGEVDNDFAGHLAALEEAQKHTWGTSMGHSKEGQGPLEHVELVLHVAEDEGYIVRRLYREKRCGRVWMETAHEYIFAADLYDAMELLPWVRAFIGRIVRFSCSNKKLERLFYDDLKQMQDMYGMSGGDGDAVQ